jgi:hypothetical protein
MAASEMETGRHTIYHQISGDLPADGRSYGRLQRIDDVIAFLEWTKAEFVEPSLVAHICQVAKVGSVTAWRYAFQLREDDRVRVRVERGRLYYRARHGRSVDA